MLSHFSCVRLFATPWTVARQAPLFMGIFQARIPEWVAMPFSRGSFQPRDPTQVSCIAGGFFTVWATGEALSTSGSSLYIKETSIYLWRKWNHLHSLSLVFPLCLWWVVLLFATQTFFDTAKFAGIAPSTGSIKYLTHLGSQYVWWKIKFIEQSHPTQGYMERFLEQPHCFRYYLLDFFQWGLIGPRRQMD